MIDNIIMLLSGTIHGRSPDDVLERCHPLGYFDTLATVAVAQSSSPRRSRPSPLFNGYCSRRYVVLVVMSSSLP